MYNVVILDSSQTNIRSSLNTFRDSTKAIELEFGWIFVKNNIPLLYVQRWVLILNLVQILEIE
jgi:hypothetical protein